MSKPGAVNLQFGEAGSHAQFVFLWHEKCVYFIKFNVVGEN